MGDMAFVFSGGEDWSRGVKVYETRRTNTVIWAKDRLERRHAVGRCNDSFVDAVGSVMRELKQEQHLRESVVLEYDAFGKPAFRDPE